MLVIILSGVGGSTNWLPLIFPLVGLVIILKFGEIGIQYLKRKKLEYENRIMHSYKDTNIPHTDNSADELK